MKTPEPTFTYRSVVVRPVDGDTCVLQIDVGFRFYATMPVRLLGLNAPEHNTPAGAAASEWTAAWLAAHHNVVVTTEANPEKYGRWLGTIVGEDGSVLNDELIKAGHALPWDGKGPRPV